MQQLVLMLDAVVSVTKVQAGLLWGALRGGAAACTSSHHIQVTVVSSAIVRGQRQVKKQPLRQRCDVVQIAERGAGASPVGTAMVSCVALLLAGTNPSALLGLLVLLDLCVQAVTLLFGHSTKLYSCSGEKRNI